MTSLSVVPNRSSEPPHRWAQCVGMKLSLRKYHVIATNPGGWQSVYIDVCAANREQAASHAMLELVRMRLPSWTIDIVVEAEVAA